MSSQLENLLEHEMHAAQGKLTDINDIYLERVYRGQYIQAEGLSWLSDDKMEKIRTFISRGQFLQAKELLQLFDVTEILSQQEVLFEEARITCLEGKFEETLEKINQLFKNHSINPLTALTALQLQSLALLELGKAQEALEVTDQLLGLETLFPSSQAALFARVTRARAFNDLGHPIRADLEAQELWEKIKSGTFVVNKTLQLIMYCRLKDKLSIKRGESFAAYALSGHWLAKEMGSPLHEAFFLLDLSECEDPSLREFAHVALSAYLDRFSCIKRFQQKITTNNSQNVHTGLDKFIATPPKNLLFQVKSYLYSFHERTLTALDLQDKSSKLIQFIQNKKMEKETVFKQVWDSPHFHGLYHDSSIRTALKRLRGETGINITSKDMVLEITDCLVV